MRRGVIPHFSAHVRGALRRASTVAVRGGREGQILKYCSEGHPVLVHCGATWSSKSREVEERLRQWATGRGGALHFVSAELAALPQFISKYNVQGVPTVLFFNGGKLVERVHGSDEPAVKRVLQKALLHTDFSSEVTGDMDAEASVLTADVLLARDKFEEASGLFQHALQARSSGNFALRARLGLLRCALAAASGGAGRAKVKEALFDFCDNHAAEVNEAADARALVSFVTHVELVIDAWDSHDSVPEGQILRHYVEGRFAEAVEEALEWYRQTAGGNIEELIDEYCGPERPIIDRGAVPSGSVFALYPFEVHDRSHERPRALLRRLFSALGPTHEAVANARAALEMCLDRKQHVPFFTRRYQLRKGGAPEMGMGTGKRSGHSKPYWIAYGPGTTVPNTKPIGGPHTADGHHSFQ